MQGPREQLAHALRLYHEGDLPRAQMLLETLDLDDLEPQVRIEAGYLWGVVLARRGDALEASQRFQQCVSLNPRFFPALDAWGNVLAGLGDARGAIEKYRRALGVAPPPSTAHILFNYGTVLLRAGYVERGLRKFRESFRLRPDGDTAYMAGVCFLALRRPRGARKWLRQSIRLQAGSARNYTALGDAFAMEGRDGEAVAAFARALDFDETFHDAWYNWAAHLAERGDYAGCIRTAKSGLRHHPRSFELITQQVFGLRQLGAYDAALIALRRARALVAASPVHERAAQFDDLLTANEGAVQRALGRARQSRGTLVEFLRRSPETAPHTLGELQLADARPLSPAQKLELTVHVQPAAESGHSNWDGTRPRGYRRTYWVVARSMREARRLVRDLEPIDAEVRFESDASVLEELKHGVQGVMERSPAIPID